MFFPEPISYKSLQDAGPQAERRTDIYMKKYWPCFRSGFGVARDEKGEVEEQS
jgi:hypothetical protein